MSIICFLLKAISGIIFPFNSHVVSISISFFDVNGVNNTNTRTLLNDCRAF